MLLSHLGRILICGSHCLVALLSHLGRIPVCGSDGLQILPLLLRCLHFSHLFRILDCDPRVLLMLLFLLCSIQLCLSRSLLNRIFICNLLIILRPTFCLLQSILCVLLYLRFAGSEATSEILILQVAVLQLLRGLLQLGLESLYFFARLQLADLAMLSIDGSFIGCHTSLKTLDFQLQIIDNVILVLTDCVLRICQSFSQSLANSLLTLRFGLPRL